MFRHVLGLLALLCSCGPTFAGSNLDLYLEYSFPVPHPICGINPNYPSPPPALPNMPELPPEAKSLFAICRTLAGGFSANDPQGASGQDELTRLLATMFANGGWDSMFYPINNGPLLECGVGPPPLGLGPMPTPGGGPAPMPLDADLPTCSKSDITQFLSTYNAVPTVAGFKKMVERINSLDLSIADTASKLQIARAAVVAGGGQISFDDVAEMLSN